MLAMPWVRAHTEKLSSTRCSTGKQAKSKSGKLKRPGQDEAVGRDENVHEENTKFSVNLAGTPQCITIKLGKQKFRSLIDTGAEVSLVSEKVIEKINPKPKLSRRKVALQSVSGEALFVKGSTDLEFKVGNIKKKNHTFQVVRGLTRNFILGTDWMSKNGVRIYFDLRN